jgi:hypothetical protein
VKTSIFPILFYINLATLLSNSFLLFERFGEDLCPAGSSSVSRRMLQRDEGQLNIEILFKLVNGHLLLFNIIISKDSKSHIQIITMHDKFVIFIFTSFSCMQKCKDCLFYEI